MLENYLEITLLLLSDLHELLKQSGFTWFWWA